MNSLLFDCWHSLFCFPITLFIIYSSLQFFQAFSCFCTTGVFVYAILIILPIKYVFLKDPSKRFGAALGALSGGRVGITDMCTTNLKLAVTIAIRYSGVRRQFGPTKGEEIPVLEYQLQVSNSTSFFVSFQVKLLTSVFTEAFLSSIYILL